MRKIRITAVALVLAGTMASSLVAVRADDDRGHKLALCNNLSTAIQYLSTHHSRLNDLLLKVAQAAFDKLGC